MNHPVSEKLVKIMREVYAASKPDAKYEWLENVQRTAFEAGFHAGVHHSMDELAKYWEEQRGPLPPK